MIRHAKISEITDILSITTACATHMIQKGIYQWNAHYPSEKVFIEDIARNELYLLVEGKLIIGMIVISTRMDAEYAAVSWKTPNQHNIYIHRLAVHPDHQGKGYAQQLMDYAETYAKEKKYTSVRLDTFSQNPRNQRFYKARGYQQLDTIYYPKQSEHPFYCFELVW